MPRWRSSRRAPGRRRRAQLRLSRELRPVSDGTDLGRSLGVVRRPLLRPAGCCWVRGAPQSCGAGQGTRLDGGRGTGVGSVIPAGEVSKVATPTARLAPPALLLLPLRPRGRAPRPGAGRLTVVLTASRTSGPNPLPPDPEFSRSLNSPSQPPPPRAWGAEPPGWWEERPTAGRGCARRRARRPARERPLHPLPRPRHRWKGRNSGTCPGELSWSFEPPPLGNRADASVA